MCIPLASQRLILSGCHFLMHLLMANVPGMTGWGMEASVPKGYNTADLLEDGWFEHVASFFWSSSFLPVLPANGLGAKAFTFAHVVVGACLPVPVSVTRFAHHQRGGFSTSQRLWMFPRGMRSLPLNRLFPVVQQQRRIVRTVLQRGPRRVTGAAVSSDVRRRCRPDADVDLTCDAVRAVDKDEERRLDDKNMIWF